eukprot:tig00020675_g12646.t1
MVPSAASFRGVCFGGMLYAAGFSDATCSGKAGADPSSGTSISNYTDAMFGYGGASSCRRLNDGELYGGFSLSYKLADAAADAPRTEFNVDILCENGEIPVSPPNSPVDSPANAIPSSSSGQRSGSPSSGLSDLDKIGLVLGAGLGGGILLVAGGVAAYLFAKKMRGPRPAAGLSLGAAPDPNIPAMSTAPYRPRLPPD